MQIISHRGYWKNIKEKNQAIAFKRSFELGFGTETDVRDCAGKLLISHDMPKGKELSFDNLLEIMECRNLPLAINIKADGLCLEIKKSLEKYNHTNYFCFDMSIPDMLFQAKHNMNIYTGLNDIVNQTILLNHSVGIWLDAFYSDWYNANLIDYYINDGISICIVSSELHNRTNNKQWEKIKQCQSLLNSKLMLCTDTPEQAKDFFYEN